MLDFGRTHLFPNYHEDERYYEICSVQIDICIKEFIQRFGIMMGTFVIGISRMNYATIFMGIKATCAEMKIFYIEEKSNSEFLVNYVIQTIIMTWGLFGYLVMEFVMQLGYLAIAISPKLITFEFQKLDDLFEKSKLTPSQVSIILRNITLQVMDIDRYTVGSNLFWIIHILCLFFLFFSYIVNMAYLLYWRCLIAPPAFTYSIAMSIFCEYVVSFHFLC